MSQANAFHAGSASNGINAYTWEEYEKAMLHLIELEDEEEIEVVAYANAMAYWDNEHPDAVADGANVVYMCERVESGHDWVSSQTRKKDGSIREEFTEPVVHLEDRYMADPELEIGPREAVCNWCNLVYNAANKVCLDCVESSK